MARRSVYIRLDKLDRGIMALCAGLIDKPHEAMVQLAVRAGAEALQTSPPTDEELGWLEATTGQMLITLHRGLIVQLVQLGRTYEIGRERLQSIAFHRGLWVLYESPRFTDLRAARRLNAGVPADFDGPDR